MAQRTTVTLEDDLDGSEASETIEFGIDGKTYEIDLSDAHAKDLRGELEAYIAVARKISGRRQPAQRKAAASDGYNRETKAQIRSWGRQNGFEVSERGRLPGPLVTAWEQAHPTQRAA